MYFLPTKTNLDELLFSYKISKNVLTQRQSYKRNSNLNNFMVGYFILDLTAVLCFVNIWIESLLHQETKDFLKSEFNL